MTFLQRKGSSGFVPGVHALFLTSLGLLFFGGCAHGRAGASEGAKGAKVPGAARCAGSADNMGLLGFLGRRPVHAEQETRCRPGAARPVARAAKQPFSTEKERMDLFVALVGLTKAMHRFTPQTEKNLGHGWDADKARLARLFREADDQQKLMLALWQFGNSLHNPHCRYIPPGRPSWITTDILVDVEWLSGKPRFYVARARGEALSKQVRPGDIVVSFDGISADHFLDELDLWSNANNRFAMAAQIAGRLSHRPWVGKLPRPVTWVLRHRNDSKAYEVTTPWRRTIAGKPPRWNERQIDYKHLSCPGGPRNYGPYELTAVGVNFCFYRADKAPYKYYPIVRQHVFYYAYDASWLPKDTSWEIVRRFVAADRDHLVRLLAQAGRIRGVILDLRGNHGGNNPNWFLDWWAPRPYTDHFVFERLHPKLAAKYRRVLEYSTNETGKAIARGYLAAFEHPRPGQKFAPKRTFFCLPGNCRWSNRYESHPLVSAPVALLVGPGCVSSCDHVAQVFSDYHFGPLVGSPTATGYTVTRHRVHLSLGPSRDLGFMSFALSYEVSGKTGKPVEAVPLHLSRRIDRSFANRDRYDRILVDAAISELRRGRWPVASRRAGKRRR